MTDPWMSELRAMLNNLVEECARAAERGGPDEVRRLKTAETDTIPARKGKQQE